MGGKIPAVSNINNQGNLDLVNLNSFGQICASDRGQTNDARQYFWIKLTDVQD